MTTTKTEQREYFIYKQVLVPSSDGGKALKMPITVAARV
jgi:hypothetical protein